MSLMSPLTSRSDFDRLFTNMAREFFGPSSSHLSNDMDQVMQGWLPAIDMMENEKEIILHAATPGIKPQDIKLEVEGKMLILSGESREETKNTSKNYHSREIRQGSFYRQVTLPAEVDGDKAQARYEDGILKVTLPKVEQSKRHEIQIGKS